MSPSVAALQAFLDARQAAGEPVAVVLIECGVVPRLDAAWGYAVGDAARDFFASRLRVEALREHDLLVDAGRDDLACALASVGDSEVAHLAAEKLLRALDAPLMLGDDDLFADAAIGIALVTAGEGDAATALGHARAACSLARERPERITVFSGAVNTADAVRMQEHSRLRAAMVHEAMDFLFRPQFDLRTGMLVGADCALRWEGGEVQAREAIAAARGARRVNEATRWVIGGALRHCSELREGCMVDLHVGVNISARDLHAGELAESILGLLKVWNLRPSRLALGVSDVALLARPSPALDMLQALGAAGVRLGLDDPAAGLSALSQLEPLPFAEFRLDASLLRGLPGSARQQSIVRAVAGIAHELRMEVLADGVADAATAACLKDLGCDILQGDHVGPLRDAAGFIEAHQQ